MKDIDELIADYLSDALEPAARRDFEQQLTAAPDLAARVALERELARALAKNAPENLFRENLKAIAQKFKAPEDLAPAPQPPGEPSGGEQFFRATLAAGVLLVALLFWWKNVEKPAETPQPTAPTNIEPAPPPAADLPPANEKTIEKPADKDIEKNAPARPPQPIAAAGFRPIRRLEEAIGSQVRGGSFRVRVLEPAAGATLHQQNGQVALQLSGKVEGTLPADTSLDALVFSNNVADFEAMRPLVRLPLALAPDGSFAFQKKLSVSPGLFYLLVENGVSGEWLVVSKFLVN